jgi:hypothetical protein
MGATGNPNLKKLVVKTAFAIGRNNVEWGGLNGYGGHIYQARHQ